MKYSNSHLFLLVFGALFASITAEDSVEHLLNHSHSHQTVADVEVPGPVDISLDSGELKSVSADTDSVLTQQNVSDLPKGNQIDTVPDLANANIPQNIVDVRMRPVGEPIPSVAEIPVDIQDSAVVHQDEGKLNAEVRENGTELIGEAPKTNDPQVTGEIGTFGTQSDPILVIAQTQDGVLIPPEPEPPMKPEDFVIPIVKPGQDLSLSHLLAEHDSLVFGPIVLGPKTPPRKSFLTQLSERPCPWCFFQPMKPGSKNPFSFFNAASMQRSNLKLKEEEGPSLKSEDVPLYRRDLMKRRLNKLRTQRLIPGLRYADSNVEWVDHIPYQAMQLPLEQEDNSRSLWPPSSWSWWPTNWFSSSKPTTLPPPGIKAPLPTQITPSSPGTKEESDIIILPPKQPTIPTSPIPPVVNTTTAPTKNELANSNVPVAGRTALFETGNGQFVKHYGQDFPYVYEVPSGRTMLTPDGQRIPECPYLKELRRRRRSL